MPCSAWYQYSIWSSVPLLSEIFWYSSGKKLSEVLYTNGTREGKLSNLLRDVVPMSENESQSPENEEYLPSKRFVTQAATICIILTACALWDFSQGQIINAVIAIIPVFNLVFALIRK